MVIYTDNGIPARFAGYTIGLVTLIRPEFKDDKGLDAHEAIHRDQFKKNPVMGLLYRFSKKARLKYELEAYRVQLTYAPQSAARFAYVLSHNYGLDITEDEALKLLVAPN
jgi:hypothetical protein